MPPELRTPAIMRHKDFAGLAKDYLDLEKASLRLPTADATQEERDAFYSKLGRPEAPDKYEIKFADDMPVDEKLVGSFKEQAHKLGLSQQQAQAIAEWYGGQAEGILSATGAQKETQFAEWNKELEKEWGWRRERNEMIASRALSTLLKGDIDHPVAQLLISTGLENHPALVKLFYEMGMEKGEDKLVTADTGPSEDDRVGARERIDEIRRDKENPYWDSRKPGYKEARAEMRRLYDLVNLPQE